MKKAEVIEKLEMLKERALKFLATENATWNHNDPVGFANEHLKAHEIVHGVDYITSEIEFISNKDADFEILPNVDKFKEYVTVSELLKREDVKKKKTHLEELYGNIVGFSEYFDEKAYKMAEIKLFGPSTVYIIYIDKV